MKEYFFSFPGFFLVWLIHAVMQVTHNSFQVKRAIVTCYMLHVYDLVLSFGVWECQEWEDIYIYYLYIIYNYNYI